MDRRGQTFSLKYVVLGLILIAVALTVIVGSSTLIPNTFGIIGEETEATEEDFDEARGEPASQEDDVVAPDSTADTSDTTVETGEEETSETADTTGESSQTVRDPVQASFQGDDGVTVRLNPSDTSGTREVDVALRVNNDGQNRVVDRKTVTCRGSCSTSFGFTPENGDEVTVEAQTTGSGGSTLLGQDTDRFGTTEQNPLCSVTLWSDPHQRGGKLETSGGSTLHIGDSAGSVEIDGGASCEATLFQHADYDGNSVTVESDVERLGNLGRNAPWFWCRGNWGNCASSIRLSGGNSCRATLYTDSGFSGDSLTVTGDSTNLHIGDDVSSTGDVSCDIVFYEEEGFDGPYMRTDYYIDDFTGDAVSNSVPSFEDNEISSLVTLNGRIEVTTGSTTYLSHTGSDSDDEDWIGPLDDSTSITIQTGDSVQYRIPGRYEESSIRLTSPVEQAGSTGTVTVQDAGEIDVSYEWSDPDSEEVERESSIGGDDRTGAYTATHQINSLPTASKPDGTFRVLTPSIGFGPGSTLNEKAEAIEQVLEEESVFNTCQSPEESVQVVPLAEECSNKETVQDVCQYSLAEAATNPLSNQGACARDCADAIIQCAASYAEEHNLEWDKAHGILQTDAASAGMVDGCAPKADFLNDNEGNRRGGSVTLKPGSNNGTTGSHEIGHDFGLCHGKSESYWGDQLSVRPCKPAEDPSCNPVCDPEEDEDCTQEVADAFGTCTDCQSSYCPNDDPADREDIMNYQDGRVFMSQENQHLETHPQLESIIEQCRE